ncbi:MAG: enoyl-CoA hydratase-related protein [Hyphomicrobiaceae bacterium]
MSTAVTYESKDQIAVITLNRPDKMNRMDNALMDGLCEAWQKFMASDDRVAVLTGAGTQGFLRRR